MDYHVFILSRIREGHDQGLNTRDAIRSGITHSAGVITSDSVMNTRPSSLHYSRRRDGNSPLPVQTHRRELLHQP